METIVTTYKDFVYSKNFNPGHYGVTAIVLFLKEMFNNNSDLGFTVFDDSLNKEDSFDSLLIASKFDWEEKYRNKRPALIVSRGNIITGTNGTQGQGKVLSITQNGEKTSYSDLISFPLMVECLSESDIQAEALASMVNIFISADLRPVRSLGLQLQGSLNITAPQIFEKQNISFISSVIMQVQMNRMYTAKVLGLTALNKIIVKLNDSTIMNIS